MCRTTCAFVGTCESKLLRRRGISIYVPRKEGLTTTHLRGLIRSFQSGTFSWKSSKPWIKRGWAKKAMPNPKLTSRPQYLAGMIAKTIASGRRI